MNPMIKLTRRQKSEISNTTTFNKSFYLASYTKTPTQVYPVNIAKF